jgi:hypothetical protein
MPMPIDRALQHMLPNGRTQVKFFEVSEEELEQQRVAFATGQLQLDIAEEEFDMGAYNKFLAEVAPEAEKLKQQQQAASVKQVTTTSPVNPCSHVRFLTQVSGTIGQQSI